MKTYDIYTMDKWGNAKRVKRCHTLARVRDVVIPLRDGYVYVIYTIGNPPKPRYMWGCINDVPHTVDMRNAVRDILRS